MSNASTAKIIKAYAQGVPEPSGMFSAMFNAAPENYFSSEAVELDIERSGEDVAIVVQDISAGYRLNTDDLYTNKRIVPPAFKEKVALNSFDLLKRQFGASPFEDPAYRADLIKDAFKKMRKIERKIRRANELQAAQVMQTGKATFTNETGATLFTLDYKPKATHFPTPLTAWDASGDNKLGNIEALAEVVRADGLYDPDELIFGSKAYASFINDTSVKALMDVRRVNVGEIVPLQKQNTGASYRGTIEIGPYVYKIYTYDGRYKNPNGGASTPYMSPTKVIVRASGARMDACFGAVPNIGQLLGLSGTRQVLSEMPSRFPVNNMDLFVNIWLSDDGDALNCGIASRPIYIPTAIDTFGCLTTGLS